MPSTGSAAKTGDNRNSSSSAAFDNTSIVNGGISVVVGPLRKLGLPNISVIANAGPGFVPNTTITVQVIGSQGTFVLDVITAATADPIYRTYSAIAGREVQVTLSTPNSHFVLLSATA